MAKILLVEDDKLQARVTEDYLESEGFEVICIDSGRGAIEIAKTQPVDLMLLEFVLPDISGDEACRILKNMENTKGVPIIVLTSKSSTDDKVAGLNAGADDYLTKPYSEKELTARIYANLRVKAFQDELRRTNRQLVEALSKVEILADTDSMTGLFNRRHFDAILEKEFDRTLRYQSPTSCVMIDVDNFKRINDEYGHSVGDICLKEIADIIKKCVRKIDTAARWGGEEFIILLPQTKKEDAVSIASRILTSVSNNRFSSISRHITVSVGIAGVPDSSIDTTEKLINTTDLEMYEAKARGGNRIEIA